MQYLLLKKVDGSKFYIGAWFIIALLFLNHFVVHIPGFGIAPYDGEWLFYICLLLLGIFGRSALKKLEGK